MGHTITLTLPDNLYNSLKRLTRSNGKSVESTVMSALSTSLPSLDGLPADWIAELEHLETLPNNALRLILQEKLLSQQQARLDELLDQEQTSLLTQQATAELDSLIAQGEKITLRKARAAVLLRFRGHRLPTLTEMHHLQNGA